MSNADSISTEQLAERWQRRPEWITMQARDGGIPGAWKLGHLWRFRLADVEAFELAQTVGDDLFALTAGSKARSA